jgi:hypothetical protein
MAYSELIKNLVMAKDYMRSFYIFGFNGRSQYDRKSPRSYDDERRRLESWLGDYVSFRHVVSGKTVFLSIDGRKITHNPFYRIYKAKSFTPNDIILHFYLMDILADGESLTVTELFDHIEKYMSYFQKPHIIDESTLRKKLIEYKAAGLVECVHFGHGLQYHRTDYADHKEIIPDSWRNALSFFSEADPMGLIGSYLLDKIDDSPVTFFRFKHHFLIQALDSDTLLEILSAMMSGKNICLKMQGSKDNDSPEVIVHPMKIYHSTQNGRQYLLAWNHQKERPFFYRLDYILKAKKAEIQTGDFSQEDQDEMPSVLYIISDMEFNCAVQDSDKTVYDNAKGRFKSFGYQLPAVVFHNVSSWQMQAPVTAREKGTAFVSGAGTAAFK